MKKEGLIVSLHVVKEYGHHGQLKEALNKLQKIDGDPLANIYCAEILHFLGNDGAALTILENLNSNQFIHDNLELIEIAHSTLKIEISLSQGNTDDLVKGINNLKEKITKIDPEETEDNGYWVGKFYQLQGQWLDSEYQYDEAIVSYKKSEKIFSKHKNERENANSIHKIGQVFENKGDLDSALASYNQALKQRTKLGNEYDIANSMNRLGVIFAKKSDYKKAEKFLISALDYSKRVNHQVEFTKINTNLGNIMKMRGDLVGALEYYSLALNASKKLGHKDQIAKNYINIGLIEFNNGELDKALTTYNDVLPLVEKFSSLREKASLFNNLGIIYQKKGDFSHALKYLKMSLQIKQNLGQNPMIASALHNIGVIYLHKGELNNALKNFEKSLEVWEGTDNKVDRATALQYIGLIHLEKNQHEFSREYLERCLNLRRTIKNEIQLSETLYYLIILELDSDNPKQAENFYNELQKINKKVNNKLVKTRARLAQAVMLQKDTRINKIVEAQELFEEVLSEDLIDNELTIFAMLKLCEFLLLELKVSGEKEVLIEIKTLLEKLYEMAQEQESHTLLIEILIIQSQLALADYNIKETKEFLENANEIAEAKELAHYKLKISYLMDSVEKDVIKYANIASTIPINERIDQLAIESYLKEVADHKDLNSFNPEMFKTGLKKNLQMHLNFANLLLMDKTLPEEMKKYVHFIDLSAKEIQFSISTLLMIEKLEANTYYQNLEDFNLDELIQLRINNYEEKLNEKSLVVDFQHTNGISAVRSDSYLLSRIIDHLLDNAIKFADEKSTIKIILETDENSRTITVENECDPIPEYEQSNLFVKYTQYLVHESTRKHGVGLGLSFCDHAIKSIKGEIKLVSPRPNKDNGVSVTVKIPKEF